MRYVRSFNESNNAPFTVVIEFEHGDDKVISEVPLTDENKVHEFLSFIFDIRRPYKYNGLCLFSDASYTSTWIKEIDKKYGGDFFKFIPKSKYYRSPNNEYHPNISKVYLKEGNDILNVIWSKGLKMNDNLYLPKIGDTIILSTGHINGGTLGLSVFGGKIDNYLDFNDFYEVLEASKYYDIDVTVADCKILLHGNYDYCRFEYNLLCRLDDKYLVTQYKGFDPKYGDKFHRPEYGTYNYFLV